MNKMHKLKVLPIYVIDPRKELSEAINEGEEFESLIKTLGGEIKARIIQKLYKPNLATYIGKGKITEVIQLVKEEQTDVVILNAMAKPGQVHKLKTILQKVKGDIEVWDRVDLILQIFDKHAATAESKLQIELARMNYMGPRIYGMGFVLSRQGGGIGTLGIGETNTELMKRHWRDEKKRINEQLAKLSRIREEQMNRRKRAGFKTVSLVGYTNAGKSSVFNLLTGKNKLVKNILFATLESSVGRMYSAYQEILVSDTIGFIRDLPPMLVKAFKSTLMESTNADLLLQVIDVSDKEYEKKIEVVMKILNELGRNTDNMIMVFNKTDMLKEENIIEVLKKKHRKYFPIFISARERKGIDNIKSEIEKRLQP